MEKYMVIVFMLFTSCFVFSQQDKYLFLVNKACDELDFERIKLNPDENMGTEFLRVGSMVGSKHRDVLDEIINTIKRNHPDWSDRDILKEYLKTFALVAIDSCPAYYNMILIPLGACPQSNKTLRLLKNEVDEFILDNPDKSYSELHEMVISHIIKTISENTDLVFSDYEEGTGNPRFYDEMSVYLFYKSKLFVKVSVSYQIDKMFDMD